MQVLHREWMEDLGQCWMKHKTEYADDEESNEPMSQRKLSKMSIDW